MQSNLLRDITKDNNYENRFDLLDLGGINFGLDFSSFIKNFNCALLDYKRGLWKKSLDNFQRIAKDAPNIFKNILKSKIYDAQLYAAYDRQEDYLRILSELSNHIQLYKQKGYTDYASSHRLVWVKHKCLQIFRNDSISLQDINEFQDEISKFINGNEMLSTEYFHKSIIFAANCHPNQSVPSHTKLSYTLDKINDMKDEIRSSLYKLEVIPVLLRENKLDRALDLAYSVDNIPWARSRIVNSPEFQTLKRSKKYSDFIMSSLENPAEYTQLKTCDNQKFTGEYHEQ